MVRTLLVALSLLAAFAFWDSRLTAGEQDAREASARVGRFVPEEEAGAIRISGLTIRVSGVDHTYARVGGIWRCVSAYGATALEGALLSAVESLLVAEGVVQTSNPDRAALYGFNEEQEVRISLHGAKMFSAPDRDVQLAIDVGLSIPGAEGCYARRSGSDEIWAIDHDARVDLAPAGLGSLPPLLDPSVTPGTWVAKAGNLRRILVLHNDPFRESFELQRSDVERTEQELELGLPTWEWTLRQGTQEQPCEPLRVWAYERFFAHIPYRGVLDTAEFQGEDGPRVRARVQVYSDNADPIELRIYDRHRLGGYPILNTFTGTVHLLSQEIYDLLVPDGSELVGLTGNNPWEPWLRR